jgi:hypothetical protein
MHLAHKRCCICPLGIAVAARPRAVAHFHSCQRAQLPTAARYGRRHAIHGEIGVAKQSCS